jgi:hypothetical protein
MIAKIITLIGVLCIISGGMVANNQNVLPCIVLIVVGIVAISVSVKFIKPEKP